jgi:hypothetical protein
MLLIFWPSFAVFVCFEGSNLLVPILHSNFLVLRSDFFLYVLGILDCTEYRLWGLEAIFVKFPCGVPVGI